MRLKKPDNNKPKEEKKEGEVAEVVDTKPNTVAQASSVPKLSGSKNIKKHHKKEKKHKKKQP